MLPSGFLGVDIFFPLSGFLITTLLCDEWDRRRAISLSAFIARRARRLLPALVLAVGLLAILLYALRPFPASEPYDRGLLGGLLFVSNWISFTRHVFWLNGLAATWTLAEEFQFYLVWPLLLCLLLRSTMRPRLLLAMTGLAVVVLLLCDAHLWQGPRYDHYFSPVARSAELLLGAAVAFARRDPHLFSKLGAPGIAVAAALLGLALVLGDSILYSGEGPEPVSFGTALATALLIPNLLSARRSSPGVVLTAPSLRRLGTISYGLYLYHLPIILLMVRYLPHVPVPALGLIAMPVSVALAAASWRFLEAPLLRRGRRPGPASPAAPGARRRIAQAIREGTPSARSATDAA
jgi:peptidoglycan/LPS O-acetylase OafA/YrhL